MSRRALAAAFVVATLPQWSCGGRSPAAPETPSPSPTPTPAPAATPTPTPTPTPEPTPPAGNRNAVTQVTAGVHSYLRNGKLVKGSAAAYKPGDVIYLNCTPRDEDRKPVDRHGPLQAWSVWSDDGVVYRVTDLGTFNPDVHVSKETPSGKVQAWCKVDGFRSPTHKMHVQR